MFSPHVRNSENGNLFRYKSRISGEVTEFYAERGMIRVHYPGRSGAEEYEVVPRREFLFRCKAINDSLAVKQPSDEKLDQQRLVETMILAAKRAGDQGDPLSRIRNAAGRQGLVRGRSVSLGGFFDLPRAPLAPTHKPPIPLDSVAPQPTPRLIIPGR